MVQDWVPTPRVPGSNPAALKMIRSAIRSNCMNEHSICQHVDAINFFIYLIWHKTYENFPLYFPCPLPITAMLQIWWRKLFWLSAELKVCVWRIVMSGWFHLGPSNGRMAKRPHELSPRWNFLFYFTVYILLTLYKCTPCTWLHELPSLREPVRYIPIRGECGRFFTGQNRSSNQRLGMILKVQIQNFVRTVRTRHSH